MNVRRRVYGLHAVEAALDYAASNLIEAWVDDQRRDRRMQAILGKLALTGINPQVVDRQTLDRLAAGNKHQGIVLELAMPREKGEHELREDLQGLNEPPFFLILDQVQDPHNLGACLRTADGAGVHGVIIPKDNATALTPTVCQVACGAAESVSLYRVTNLARVMRWLKKQGIWLVGSAGEAEQWAYGIDLRGPLALVIGAEGSGLRRLTRELCDSMVKLPMAGRVESLNLSVAAGILLYEAVRQRLN